MEEDDVATFAGKLDRHNRVADLLHVLVVGGLRREIVLLMVVVVQDLVRSLPGTQSQSPR